MVHHVVVESYQDYAQRRSRNFIYFMIFFVVVLALFFISLYHDWGPPPSKEYVIYAWPELYHSCVTSCTGVYSEGEEMTKTCNTNNEAPNSIYDRPDCVYNGLIYICDCLKQGNSEQTCMDKSKSYLKTIYC